MQDMGVKLFLPMELLSTAVRWSSVLMDLYEHHLWRTLKDVHIGLTGP